MNLVYNVFLLVIIIFVFLVGVSGYLRFVVKAGDMKVVKLLLLMSVVAGYCFSFTVSVKRDLVWLIFINVCMEICNWCGFSGLEVFCSVFSESLVK